MRDAIDLLEQMSRHEAAGRTSISPRLATQFEGGWMRMMFGADYESGYAATKAYHLVEGAGVRYVVSLYRLADGELLAVMDGRLITDLRTGAASGVVARKVPVTGPSTATLRATTPLAPPVRRSVISRPSMTATSSPSFRR